MFQATNEDENISYTKRPFKWTNIVKWQEAKVEINKVAQLYANMYTNLFSKWDSGCCSGDVDRDYSVNYNVDISVRCDALVIIEHNRLTATTSSEDLLYYSASLGGRTSNSELALLSQNVIFLVLLEKERKN